MFSSRAQPPGSGHEWECTVLWQAPPGEVSHKHYLFLPESLESLQTLLLTSPPWLLRLFILQKRLSKINDGVGEEQHLSPGANLGTSDGLGSVSLAFASEPQYA